MDNLDVKFDTVKTLATKWTQFQRKLACWKFYPDQKPFLKQTFVHFKNNKDYFKHHFLFSPQTWKSWNILFILFSDISPYAYFWSKWKILQFNLSFAL